MARLAQILDQEANSLYDEGDWSEGFEVGNAARAASILNDDEFYFDEMDCW